MLKKLWNLFSGSDDDDEISADIFNDAPSAVPPSPPTKPAPAAAVTPNAQEDLSTQLRRLVADGRKLDAIKLYRQRTGLDLAQAKADIDALVREINAEKTTRNQEAQARNQYDKAQRAPGDNDDPRTVSARISHHILSNKKINAIKEYRAATGLGLKESKEVIDDLYARRDTFSDGVAFTNAVQRALQDNRQPETLPPTADAHTQIQHIENLMQTGRKVSAVKAYRELTGLGLKDSKEAVEQYERDGYISIPTNTATKHNKFLPESEMNDVWAAIDAGKKIQAIKHYRAHTGQGLKEAKDAVEEMMRRGRQ